MGQVTVTLNGRTYRLRCGDGEEARLLGLAAHVKDKVEELAREFGQVGEDRLMLMAALLIADELWEAREQLAATSGNVTAFASDAATDKADAPTAARSRSSGTR